MARTNLDCVTGAFSFTGAYIARRLLARGRRVLTLTNHPERSATTQRTNDRGVPADAPIAAHPYCFDDPARLAGALAGVDTLYNTYWIRFPHRGLTFDRAVANTRTLFTAARDAGVRRIVHVSIANPRAAPKLPYYRGKAELEDFLAGLGVSHAIIRPTVVFGDDGLLINNIAWLVRRLPVFLVPGDGRYRVQPIYVDDLAALAVHAGAADDERIVEAVGPEVFRFDELVRMIAAAVGRRVWVAHAPPWLALTVARAVGPLVGDVLLTRDELRGLTADLLASHGGPPTGTTRLTGWMRQNAGTLGRRYQSELGRHFTPRAT